MVPRLRRGDGRSVLRLYNLARTHPLSDAAGGQGYSVTATLVSEGQHPARVLYQDCPDLGLGQALGVQQGHKLA